MYRYLLAYHIYIKCIVCPCMLLVPGSVLGLSTMYKYSSTIVPGLRAILSTLDYFEYSVLLLVVLGVIHFVLQYLVLEEGTCWYWSCNN